MYTAAPAKRRDKGADSCKRLLFCSQAAARFNWSRFNSSVLVITTAAL
jgi:hypothetical protein